MTDDESVEVNEVMQVKRASEVQAGKEAENAGLGKQEEKEPDSWWLDHDSSSDGSAVDNSETSSSSTSSESDDDVDMEWI